MLYDLNIDDLKPKPPDWTCTSSSFIYNLTDYVITGDLKNINNTLSTKWAYIHQLETYLLMDSHEDYARQWAKREKEDLDTLSERVKSVRSLIRIRIKKLSGLSTRSTSVFEDPNVAKNPPPMYYCDFYAG